MSNVRVTIDEEEYLALKEAKKAVEENMICIRYIYFNINQTSSEVKYVGKEEAIAQSISVLEEINKNKSRLLKDKEVDYYEIKNQLSLLKNTWYYKLFGRK